jgi:hypothetical protein
MRARRVYKKQSRPVFPSGVPALYSNMARSCWETDVHMRPSFAVIRQRLQVGLATCARMGVRCGARARRSIHHAPAHASRRRAAPVVPQRMSTSTPALWNHFTLNTTPGDAARLPERDVRWRHRCS